MARIAFISPTGYGNLGDAAIIDSLLHAIRRRSPGAEVVAFTQNPGDTTSRHGIPAFTLSGLTIRRYKIVDGASPAGPPAAAALPPPDPGLARRALGRVPGARRAYHLARQVAAERRHRRQSSDRIRGFDLVVVAGGGQLDEFWGGPFGHPYTLWRWAGLSRAAGARYVVLSVGTGTLSSLGARFVRRALALAEYRSYRDGRSRELVGDPALTGRDPVVPDLAYAVPLEPASSEPPARPAVGVSPMAYVDPALAPADESARYRRHVAALAAFTVRLVRSGRDAVLFSSDGQDRTPLAEVREAAAAELSDGERARLRVPEIDGVASLVRALRSCEVVVAARLHGVLLSHVAGRPALAISYERKVRTLMEEMAQARFCFEFDDFGPEAAWDRFLELHARRAELAEDLGRRLAGYRRRVDEQYDLVLGGVR